MTKEIKKFYDWYTNHDDYCQFDLNKIEDDLLFGDFSHFIHLRKSHLYEFFDSLGIIIEIKYSLFKFEWVIKRIQKESIYQVNFYLSKDIQYETRNLAEIEAFKKAFELLK